MQTISHVTHATSPNVLPHRKSCIHLLKRCANPLRIDKAPSHQSLFVESFLNLPSHTPILFRAVHGTKFNLVSIDCSIELSNPVSFTLSIVYLFPALKADRKRLKTEKFDVLNQMKQLYATLEDKEKELREFIRAYEKVSLGIRLSV